MLNSLLIRRLIVSLLTVLSFPATGMAHKVNIFAYAEGGIVYAESYFPNGQPVVNGKVLVLNSQQLTLLEGQTDQAGLYQFKAPETDDLTLVIDAGMGHKNTFLLNKAALKE